jgi:hypothetical protein
VTADNFLEGMVRVVAKNGTVWWCSPAAVDFYANLTQDAVAYTTDDGFNLYWNNQPDKPIGGKQ